MIESHSTDVNRTTGHHFAHWNIAFPRNSEKRQKLDKVFCFPIEKGCIFSAVLYSTSMDVFEAQTGSMSPERGGSKRCCLTTFGWARDGAALRSGLPTCSLVSMSVCSNSAASYHRWAAKQGAKWSCGRLMGLSLGVWRVYDLEMMWCIGSETGRSLRKKLIFCMGAHWTTSRWPLGEVSEIFSRI